MQTLSILESTKTRTVAKLSIVIYIYIQPNFLEI